ncbi:hypothetical protein RUM44_006528 [Polyplax serrata]|uniref:Uncharacterized protein n=1 Tax=Polyplax serrata TaxID=468196 RepID=A0ABR1AIC2_POLSC
MQNKSVHERNTQDAAPDVRATKRNGPVRRADKLDAWRLWEAGSESAVVRVPDDTWKEPRQLQQEEEEQEGDASTGDMLKRRNINRRVIQE